jgi:hypothetical protein
MAIVVAARRFSNLVCLCWQFRPVDVSGKQKHRGGGILSPSAGSCFCHLGRRLAFIDDGAYMKLKFLIG